MIEWRSVRAADEREGRQTLHQALVQDLGRMIQDGELGPGERLSEATLCERFAVSRTPLREALKVLASEGYVVWRANHGVSVAQVRPAEVMASFEVLAGLERLIGESLAGRLDAGDLHELEAMHARMVLLHAGSDRPGYFRLNQLIHARLAAATGNPVLADIYQSLQRRVYRARALSNSIRLRWNESVAEHEGIMEALRRRDATLLAERLMAHSRATQAVILRHLHDGQAGLDQPAAASSG